MWSLLAGWIGARACGGTTSPRGGASAMLRTCVRAVAGGEGLRGGESGAVDGRRSSRPFALRRSERGPACAAKGGLLCAEKGGLL